MQQKDTQGNHAYFLSNPNAYWKHTTQLIASPIHFSHQLYDDAMYTFKVSTQKRRTPNTENCAMSI